MNVPFLAGTDEQVARLKAKPSRLIERAGMVSMVLFMILCLIVGGMCWLSHQLVSHRFSRELGAVGGLQF